MDKETIIGTVVGSVLITYAITMTGSLSAFVDFPSVLIVLGGGLASMLIAYPFDIFKSALVMVKRVYQTAPEYDYLQIISEILQVSDIARKEGILALDSRLGEIENPFMVRALQMIVDGVDVELVEDILNTELDSRAMRHAEVKGAIDFFGSTVPAFGMIGTIIGLVLLLGDLDDPAAIGPNMAVALITTFYGAVAANLMLIPYAKKAEHRSATEQLYGEIILRGCLFIAAGVHPRVIQERLLAFVSEGSRARYAELHMEGGGED